MIGGGARQSHRVRHTRAAPMLAACAILGSLLVRPEPAGAQVRLSNESGGNYTVDVMSWWEIPFRSVVRQQYDFSCGSAAVATLLTYHYGAPTPERTAFSRMWKAGDQPAIRKVGFSMLDMKSYLNSAGFDAQGIRLGEKGLTNLSRPAIVLLDLKGFKHFVVVKGVRDGRVLVGDPMLGLNEYATGGLHEGLERHWTGGARQVRSEAVQPRQRLGSMVESSDGRRGDCKIAADDLTTHLPQSYQLSPQILLDVNVGTVD